MLCNNNIRSALIALLFSSTTCRVHAKPLNDLRPRADSPPYPSSNSSAGGGYTLTADYSGATFFDHFDTFSGPDPTNGFVRYVDMSTAAQAEYVGFIYNLTTNATTAYIGVDKSGNSTAQGRGSVRLTSKQTFDVGTLVAMDVRHAPVAYGAWPAAWMLGSVGQWPSSGEIDILEWVHETDFNSMTLHTAPGCVVQNSTDFAGPLSSSDCNAGQGGLGCSIPASGPPAQGASNSSSSTLATAGPAFNAQGGGVYVMDWQTTGITIWLFAHDQLPSDLVAGSPQPSLWAQKPLAKFSGPGCDFSTAFQKQNFIFDITFCGGWAGKPDVWQADAAQKTGFATCQEYVQAPQNAQAFAEAYFEIAGMRFFSSSSTPATGGAGAPATKRHEPHGVEFKSITRPLGRAVEPVVSEGGLAPSSGMFGVETMA